ncbi:uncharacterized protein LOC105440795 [Strongylocentrotus purpuratus]|uniref:Uncharacterized protein n=1 Tax=Strongylocentrotus purpuratus TaxID=7668 RepID=A0A7M7NNS1_STRPU|nr:uncharacterized protein LOC105440795 [Strongylocentrotus purpuratus]
MKRQSSLKDFFNPKRQNAQDDSESFPASTDCPAAEHNADSMHDVEEPNERVPSQNSTEVTLPRSTEDPMSTKSKSSEQTILEAKPIADEIVLETIKSYFDNSNKFHSFYHCNRKCSTLSSDEKNAQSKFTHKFKHEWLVDRELSYCSELECTG